MDFSARAGGCGIWILPHGPFEAIQSPANFVRLAISSVLAKLLDSALEVGKPVVEQTDRRYAIYWR